MLIKLKGRAKNLTNLKFGRLLALEPTNKRYNENIVWKCVCDCGTITYKATSRLLSGNAKSCGCLIHEHKRPPKGKLSYNYIHGKSKTLRYRIEWRLKHIYGITLKEYKNILKNQDYKCAVCRKHYSLFNKNLCVDHIHKSKIIRGLLCDRCNLAIGLLQDGKFASNLIKYLSKTGGHYEK